MQDRTALVLYGTETGNAQDLAEEIGQILERLLFQTHVLGLEAVVPESISSFTLTVFVISTTGQGDFPSNAKAFWTYLLKKRLRPDYLAGVDYALVGLADSSYPKFNWAARKLQKRLQQLGAREVLEPCEADEQGEDSTEGAFLAWCQIFRPALLERFPLPHGTEPLDVNAPLPSKCLLGFAHKGSDGEQAILHDISNFPSGKPDIDRRYLPDTLNAILESNLRVTPENHWQDVRLLTLTLKTSIPYLPGDALSILPKNFHQDVSKLIELMGWTSIADVPLKSKDVNGPSKPSRLNHVVSSNAPHGTSLRTLLSEHLDITAIPRRSFFAKAAGFTADSMHKERLLEFTDPQYLDEYYDYATRPRRSILEILQEFDSVKIPWQEATNIFPAMRPRQFSIASGGSLKRNSDGTTRFELLVAIVKYRTVIKKIRQGVCTRYLAALPAGSTLNVCLRTEGRFHARPQDFRISHILIGAGTGVAPLRALIYEKQLVSHRLGSTRSTTLIFGSRNSNTDYFFKDEWDRLIPPEAGFLNVVTAFSRDQKAKIYVQDRIREESESLFHQIHDNNATIILCGSSGSMPKAVREALVDVLESGFTAFALEGADARKAAELYLMDMEKAGRLQQETW